MCIWAVCFCYFCYPNANVANSQNASAAIQFTRRYLMLSLYRQHYRPPLPSHRPHPIQRAVLVSSSQAWIKLGFKIILYINNLRVLPWIQKLWRYFFLIIITKLKISSYYRFCFNFSFKSNECWMSYVDWFLVRHENISLKCFIIIIIS